MVILIQCPALTAGSKGFFGGPDCSHQITAVSFDLHTLCVHCLGLCEVHKHCDDCKEWDNSLFVKSYRHQLTLQGNVNVMRRDMAHVSRHRHAS